MSRKTALVTGASRGIGKAIAKELLSKGYHVIGTSRDPEKLRDRIDGVDYLPLDLMNQESIQALVDQIDRIDVLINNAGASQMGPVEDVPVEKIREVFDLNFFGHVSLIQGILPKMRQRGGGRIVNISSFASHTPVPFSAVYAASKSAIEVLSLGLQNEVEEFGIKVIAVAPTFVKTSIHQDKICDNTSPYYAWYRMVSQKRDAQIESGTDPKCIAEQVVKIIEKKNPAPFYAVGERAGFLRLGARLLNERALIRSIRSNFKS